MEAFKARLPKEMSVYDTDFAHIKLAKRQMKTPNTNAVLSSPLLRVREGWIARHFFLESRKMTDKMLIFAVSCDMSKMTSRGARHFFFHFFYVSQTYSMIK